MDGAIGNLETVTATVEHRVEISALYPAGRSGHRYSATYGGEVIVPSSKNPELDACRVLRDRGLIGTMVTYFAGRTTPRLRVDIEKGAKLRISETATEGPAIRAHKPFPQAIDGDADE